MTFVEDLRRVKRNCCILSTYIKRRIMSVLPGLVGAVVLIVLVTQTCGVGTPGGTVQSDTACILDMELARASHTHSL